MTATKWNEDTNFLRSVFSTPGLSDDFQDIYGIWKDNADDPQIGQQVAIQMQRATAHMLRNLDASGIKRPNMSTARQIAGEARAGGNPAGLYDDNAAGAGLDGKFTDLTEYIRTVWHRGDPGNPKLMDLRNYSSDVPSEGGFLVPEQFRSDLLALSLETSIVRPRAMVLPMNALRLNVPAVDSTSNETSVFGGVVGYWTEEGATLTPSSASFDRIALDAKKLTVYSDVPNELLSDAPAATATILNRLLPAAISFYEDTAFLTGTGVGEPLGLLNSSGAVTVARGTANQIAFSDVVNMFARMLPQSLANSVWLASLDTFPQLAQMLVTDGSTGVASPAAWLTGGQAIAGPPVTMFGRPVIFTEKVPKLGTAGDLCFVDLSMYLVGDRQAMQLRTSEHIKFDQDKTAVRLIERADGRPWLQSPITPANGGDTLSAYVLLGDAA